MKNKIVLYVVFLIMAGSALAYTNLINEYGISTSGNIDVASALNSRISNISNILYTDPGNYSDIQAKIDLCPSSGCTVVISPGTYQVTDSINITKNNTKLTGIGRGTILNATTSTFVLIEVYDTKNIANCKI